MVEIIGILITVVFIGWISYKVYQHEIEHLEPLVKKIKKWWNGLNDVGEEEFFSEGDDFDIGYRGLG
jgi:hypothetical protein